MRPNRYQLDHPRPLNWIPLQPKYRVFLVEVKKSESYVHATTCIPHDRLSLAPCKEIQDCLGLWTSRRGFRILCQWNLDSGFQSLKGVPDSLSCIPDSKCKDSQVHKSKFP